MTVKVPRDVGKDGTGRYLVKEVEELRPGKDGLGLLTV